MYQKLYFGVKLVRGWWQKWVRCLYVGKRVGFYIIFFLFIGMGFNMMIIGKGENMIWDMIFLGQEIGGFDLGLGKFESYGEEMKVNCLKG